MAYINGKKIGQIVKTTPVAVDIEANPSGEATEVLEKLKVDDTIYSVDGGSSTPDDEMSDSSVNAVQNKVVTKALNDLDSEKEDKTNVEDFINNTFKWEQGALDAQTGGEVTSSSRLRTNQQFYASFDGGIIGFVAKTNYEFLVFAWDTSNNYIGRLCQDFIISKDISIPSLWLKHFDLSLYKDYKFRLMFRNAINTSATITTTEASNLLYAIHKPNTTLFIANDLAGIYPYYGNLSMLNADTNADTTKQYYVAVPISGRKGELMKYNSSISSWEYTGIVLKNSFELQDLINRTKTELQNEINGLKSSLQQFRIENDKVKAFLDNTIYDNSDYSYNRVLAYAENNYDVPRSMTVEWEYTGTCDSFNVKITLNGDFTHSYTYNVPNSTRSFVAINMRPDKVTGIKVSAVSGATETVILSKAIRVTGSIRMISVGGIHNVRDIGGWDCENGKVAYGKIIRGSAIDETGSTITSAGKIVLYDLMNVRSEIDLRSTASPSQSALGQDAICYKITGYSYLNGYNNTTDAYNVLSRVFTEVTAGNVIYMHCSGGCDRTAFYICMIEGLLGVSEDDINKDFELSSFMDQAYSNDYRRYRNMGETYSNRDWAGLISLIKSGTGSTFQEKFYNYFISIGFTAEQITAFKNAMIYN